MGDEIPQEIRGLGRSPISVNPVRDLTLLEFRVRWGGDEVARSWGYYDTPRSALCNVQKCKNVDMIRFLNLLKKIEIPFYLCYTSVIRIKERWYGIMEAVVKVKKEKMTLSLTEETKNDLNELAKKYGMTKSGLVHFLVQRLKEREDLFK